MKKLLATILCVSLAGSLLTFAGCGAGAEAGNSTESTTESTTESSTEKSAENTSGNTESNSTDDVAGDTESEVGLSGGWSYNASSAEVTVPEEAKAAFEAAVEQLDGSEYKIVAYLGSQVVAGTNYFYLCEVTPVVPDATATLNVVTVYSDLEGNNSVTSANEVDATKYTQDGEIEFEELAGGIFCDDAVGAVSDSQQAVFDKATEALMSVDYTPLACIGEQVVAGKKYAFVCKATVVTAEPVSKLAVVVVYEDTEGNVEVSSICGFEF